MVCAEQTPSPVGSVRVRGSGARGTRTHRRTSFRWTVLLPPQSEGIVYRRRLAGSWVEGFVQVEDSFDVRCAGDVEKGRLGTMGGLREVRAW